MKRKDSFYIYTLLTGLLISAISCNKDYENSQALDSSTVPVLTTIGVTNISQNNAFSGGKISSDGGAAITSKGVCRSTSPNPTIADSKTTDGSGSADFTSNLTGLSVGTTYYARAYAVNKAGTGYGSAKIFTTTSSLIIGINYSGGIIFYLDSSGSHGMVCAQTDQSTNTNWGCPNTMIPGADGTSLGTGSQNTADIIAGCDSAGIAADICSNLVLNGFSDWYLPSKEELLLMYNNLMINGEGGFSTGSYWSSTEMTNVFAWEVIFSNGLVQGSGKNNFASVRAVRTF